MTLYIIGNGFDLEHKIASSFKDFKEYLRKVSATSFIDHCINYYSFKDDWSNFEEMLSKPKMKEILLDNLCWLTNDDSNIDFVIKIEDFFNFIVSELKENLFDWINAINKTLDKEKIELKYNFSEDDFFITFNYTQTLEILYDIPKEKICHLHGCVENKKTMVIGHNYSEPPNVPIDPITKKFKFFTNHFYPKLDDLNNNGNKSFLVYNDGLRVISDYFHITYKNFEEVIKEHHCLNKPFLKDYDKIYITGNSLTSVDSKYFEQIAREIDKNVKIIITYYNCYDYNNAKWCKKNIFKNNQVKYLNTKRQDFIYKIKKYFYLHIW
jgi:hypothetical protein